MPCPSDVAERVAARLPLGKLSAVTTTLLPRFLSNRAGGPILPDIYGVVIQQEAVAHVDKEDDDSDEDEDEDEDRPGFVVKAWLLKLAQVDDGTLQWQDFVPHCEKCQRMLGPVLDGDGSKKCPVCKGAKGPGKCFQFACPESSPLSYSCGNLPAKDRPVYCGSHPYFAGYLPGDQCAGSFGPPLFSMTRRMLDSNIDFVAASIYRAGCETQIDLFPVSQEVWQNEKRSVRVALTEHRQSVISATILPPHEVLSSQVSLAVAIPTDDFEDAGSIYLQRWHESDCVVKRDADLPAAWAGWSEITSEGNPHFLQQVIVLSHLQCCVGLSHDSLWTMDLSEVESGGMSASDMAGKLNWLKVMGLPAERYMRDEIPHRLLARGHGNDEVIIFALEGAKFKPQMLVELSGKPIGQSVRATKLTSTVHVCLTSADFADASLPSRLLPTVTRVGGRQSGYLFFDQLGQAHLLRDEAIIADHEAWAEPDMKDEELMQRAVSFTLQRLSGDSEKRFCLMGMLMHFEYFSKLFKGWREGASAEVCMNDIDPDAFDHFLKYAQSGKLDSNLELQMLMKLIRFGNKCILPDFLSRCLVLVLRILDEPRQMREKSPTTLAELLLLADDAAISCPTLKMKVIDSILCFRSDVLKDPQFLSKVVAQDSSLLATMLSLVVSERKDDNKWYVRVRERSTDAKRRKLEGEMQFNLWYRQGKAPRWSGCESFGGVSTRE